MIKAAVAAKFVFRVFPDVFVIVHRWIVSDFAWTEWDPLCDMKARFGSFSWNVHEDRSQLNGKLTIGIVSIPCDFDFGGGVCRTFAKWICQDSVSLMTGNFGSGNAAGIAKTAVVAGASLDHRVCGRLEMFGDSGELCMSGGFIVFAPVDQISEPATYLGGEEIQLISQYILNELNHQEIWPVASGNMHCPNLHRFKLKKLDMNHNLFGMVQHRVYVGKPMMGKKNRKRKFGIEIEGAQDADEKRAPKVEKRAPKLCADDRSCGNIAEVPPSPCKREKVECEQSQQVDMRAEDEEDIGSGPDWGDACDADNV